MPFVERKRQRIFYEETGSGPAVVLGHSFLCSGEMWQGQVSELAKTHRVINIDYRGHGRSSSPAESFTLYDLVEDTVAVLDELEIDRPVWAGLSVGGMVSLRAALTVPERVAGLILVDTTAAAEHSWVTFKYRAMGLGARLVGMKPFVSQVVPLMFGHTTRRQNKQLVEDWKPQLLDMDLPSILHFLEALVTREGLLDQLGQIDIPALVLVGEEDKALPVSVAKQLDAGLPDSSLEIIPSSGHLSALEQPEEVTRHMSVFLSSLPTS